ncbi:MAG: hypothetical protein AB1401_00840 [Thermodesulfobacteriota bacterium]
MDSNDKIVPKEQVVEGEVKYKTFRANGRVGIVFSRPVQRIDMDPNVAISIGNELLKHGRKVRKEERKNNAGDS